MGSPDLELRHNIICNSFSRNFQTDISFLWEYIKDLQAGISALWEFVTVGEASFSALWGKRVNCLHLDTLALNLDTLALRTERQSIRMSEIKNVG